MQSKLPVKWLTVGLYFVVAHSLCAADGSTVILSPRGASWAERLAAHEVRRYVYLRTGELLKIYEVAPTAGFSQMIVVAGSSWEGYSKLAGERTASELKDLRPQEYWLRNSFQGGPPMLIISGGDDAGTLYGAYRCAELLGVRFYLHGDVLPDEQTEWRLQEVNERAKPLFALRGIQPFHDFPEGPDWWNRDDYLAVLGQLPKLRMNFFGLHTYPEGRPNAEPTVWIGLPQDIGEKERVNFSYASSYQNTLRGNWGYAAKRPADYICGSGMLFERDDFGPDVMLGHVPAPTSPEGYNEVFARTALMLRDAFRFAHALKIKTCVGTETPLIVPKQVQQRLKELGRNPSDPTVVCELYAGIFRRIAQAYPIDYYWFWTPEGWTWSGTKEEEIRATTNDLNAAIAAHKQVQTPFALATCGWVLGPQQDRAMFDKVLPKDVAVSCINREVGYTPVDAGFAQVKGRGKWAIPWMEDDPALAAPQFWVGRMRRDAADALKYGCDGLLGIHWRTRVLSMNVGALARAAWDQEPWIKAYKGPVNTPAVPQGGPGPIGGQVAAFPNNRIADTADEALYQTVRYNLSAYRLPASNGVCEVTLKFCEPHYTAAKKRVFSVQLQGRAVVTNLDIFARVGQNRALDFTFHDVPVTNGWVEVVFIPEVEFPSIAAISLTGPSFTNRVNCGGPAYRDYAADMPAIATPPAPMADTADYYRDWAVHEFGPDAGPPAAAIFQKMDGTLPKPSTWVDGPGGITPDPRPWEQVRPEYRFVDELAALEPLPKSSGYRERFQYWLNTFRYLRLMGEANCAWGEFNRIMEEIKKADPGARAELARSRALPVRKKLVSMVDELFDRMLACVSNPGELGTVANWNQHNLPGLLGKTGEQLAGVLGEPLPSDAMPRSEYRGPTRLVCPTVRTSVEVGERLALKLLVLSELPPKAARLFWRRVGEKNFRQVPFGHVARGVYRVELRAPSGDFEYYAQVEPAVGKALRYPVTAPKLNQTVVVYGN